MRYSRIRVKRPLRKKTYTRKPKKVTSTKQVYKIAKRVFHNQAENKTAFNLGQLEVTPKMLAVNCFRIVPSLSQSTSQAGRIGNRSKIMRLTLGYTATLLADPNSFVDTGRAGVYFDLYIFKAIQKPSYDQTLTTSDLDYFLQAGSTFNGYTGDSFNWHQDINKDRFELVYRKRRLLNNMAYRAQGGAVEYSVYGQNSNPTIHGKISIASKINKTLKYQDGISNATNNAYYAVMVCTRGDNVFPSDVEQPFGNIMYYSNMYYEDA